MISLIAATKVGMLEDFSGAPFSTDALGFEGYRYKDYPVELCAQILYAYMSHTNGDAAYLQGEFPISRATFWRVLQDARDKGVIALRPQGARSSKLERAKQITQEYSREAGYTREQQAVFAGTSVATIYRAAPDKVRKQS